MSRLITFCSIAAMAGFAMTIVVYEPGWDFSALTSYEQLSDDELGY